MLKKVIAIFFCAVLLLQTLSRLTILADYTLNNSYIANVLCENKDKPAMHCNGKCYLSKKLQQEDKQQAPGNQKSIPEIQLFVSRNNIELFSRTGCLITSSYGRYNSQLASTDPHNIFHPPVI